MKKKTTVLIYSVFIILLLYAHLTLFVVVSWLKNRPAEQNEEQAVEALVIVETQMEEELITTEPDTTEMQDLTEVIPEENASEIQTPAQQSPVEELVTTAEEIVKEPVATATNQASELVTEIKTAADKITVPEITTPDTPPGKELSEIKEAVQEHVTPPQDETATNTTATVKVVTDQVLEKLLSAEIETPAVIEKPVEEVVAARQAKEEPVSTEQVVETLTATNQPPADLIPAEETTSTNQVATSDISPANAVPETEEPVQDDTMGGGSIFLIE